MEHTYVPEGRNSTMPVTVNAKGEPRVNQTLTMFEQSQVAYRAAIEQTGTAVGTTRNGTRGTGMTSAPSSANDIAMYNRTGTSDTERCHSPTASLSSRNTFSSATTGNKSGIGRNNEPPVLLGPPTFLILRLCCDIFALDSMQSSGVLNRKEGIADVNNKTPLSRTNINEYVIPNQIPYIPWRPENRSANSSAISAKADRRYLMRDTPTVNELNSGKIEDINANSARTAATAASIALRFETLIEKSRHMEFRNISNVVIGDLFRNIISSADIEKNLITSVTSRSDGLRLPENLSDPVIEGIPVHGIYYDEIKQEEDVLASKSKISKDKMQFSPIIKATTQSSVDFTPVEASQHEMEEKAELLLVNDISFKDIATDIMHNTIFNLMQEASYGEFPVNAEPLRFAIVKK